MDAEDVEVLPDHAPAAEGHQEREPRHRRREDDGEIGEGIDEFPPRVVAPGVHQGKRRPEDDDDRRAHRRGDEGEGERIEDHRFGERAEERFRRYTQEERDNRQRDEEEEECKKDGDEEGEGCPLRYRPAAVLEYVSFLPESGQIHSLSVRRCRPGPGRML